MGNTLCCAKQPNRDLRNKLIIGNVDPYYLDQVTIYDDALGVWVNRDYTHKFNVKNLS